MAARFEMEILDTAPGNKEVVNSRSRFRFDRALAALGMLVRLVRLLFTFRPQVVHVNTPYFWAFVRDGAIVWVSSLMGARTLMHFHGGDFEKFYASCPGWVQGAIRMTLGRVDRAIVITEPCARFIRTLLPHDRVVHLPNFVETAAFAGERVPPGPAGRLRVLYVGWVIEAKGIRELLQAVAEIPSLDLTLAGPIEPFFGESISDLLAVLGTRVTTPGPQTHDEVKALFRRADIFVLPSHREGSPMVILEAMAAGLPIVTTPVGAIPEVVRDERDGLLVPARDAVALADALKRLAEDEALRVHLSQNALERARTVFDREVVLERLAEIYVSLARAGDY